MTRWCARGNEAHCDRASALKPTRPPVKRRPRPPPAFDVLFPPLAWWREAMVAPEDTALEAALGEFGGDSMGETRRNMIPT